MIKYSTQSINEADIAAVSAALKGENLTGGELVSKFEKALALYVGVRHAVVLNSATSALHALYLACGIGKGDEIITTPITFAATANAALMTGADVRFSDIKFNGNIDPKSAQSLINERTKAIVAVDFGGLPTDASELKEICQKAGILFLNDASHALGSIYGGELAGKMVGSAANASVFSFHAIKPITTLEGGAVLSDDDEIAKKVRLFRSHGIVKKSAWDSQMSVLGYNYRLSDVACALGISQLKRIESFIQRRNEIALYYNERFKSHPLFSTISVRSSLKDWGGETNSIKFNPEILVARSSRHLYPVLLHSSLHCAKQDIFEELHRLGIGVQVHYKPVYKFELYKKRYGDMALKNAEEFYKAELSLPCHQAMSDDDAKFVADSFLKVLDKYSKGCKMG